MNQNNMMMNMLMGKLQQQNPQAYAQINQWMSSGQNPQQIINQMLQNGQISQQQLSQAQNMANQMNNTKKF
jgi:membrane peptidoglycan carboxypeptidase